MQKSRNCESCAAWPMSLRPRSNTITDAVKQEMQVQGVDTLTGDDWRATWKTVQSSRFDSKAFKIAQPDLYGAVVRQAESRRFVLA